MELNTLHLPMEQRTTYQKAFLQVMNIWTKDALVKEFVFAPRLARIAAELMGTRGTRLYHDQALYKEAAGGFTPWHADQYYWPFATNHSVTAWVPLQAVPMEMGPVAFAAEAATGSTSAATWRSATRARRRSKRSSCATTSAMVEEPFELGEVSFHAGWCFHGRATNKSARPAKS